MKVLCLASFFKGAKLLDELHKMGVYIVLVTTEKVYEERWPEGIDETFCFPEIAITDEVRKGISFLFTKHDFDAIIPIDEYTVDTAAWLREHFRVQGMGVTEAALYRDKLLMRIRAAECGIAVPSFVGAVNQDRINRYAETVRPPWILKPRAESGSVKMKKMHSAAQLWDTVEELGDDRSHYLIESFVPGDILHVDSIVWDGKVQFSAAHQYGRPPFNIWHEGGVFTTRTVPPKSDLHRNVTAMNKQLVKALGLERGVTHAEFILAQSDGALYFLEIAARVGGAFIDSLVLETCGVDLWREWARQEVAAAAGQPYKVKANKSLQGGLLVCLARQQMPDVSAYNDVEVAWSHAWDYHISMVLASKDSRRIDELLDSYQHRFAEDFLAIAPPLDHPA
jgi:biotin carboxylase